MADTITAYHSFSAGTKARSSQVNTNFSNHRGTLVPIDPNTATAIALTYDLGTTEYRWRDWYGRGLNLIGMTTAANLTLTRDNAITGGAFDLVIGATTATMRIEQGLVKTLAHSRTMAYTSTGAAIGQSCFVPFSPVLNTTRIDTTSSFTLASTRIIARAGSIISAKLIAGNVFIDAPTLPAGFCQINVSININRGATTTAMTSIGTSQYLMRAHGLTAGSNRLTLQSPVTFELWDSTFTAGEVVYEAVAVSGSPFLPSATVATINGALAVSPV
jgi:hypothetical protein